MKKASLFASAAAVSVLGLAPVPGFAQGGGPFADVPTDHWAYASVDRLQKEGVVIGYPDGTYGGKRAMTRYEFAVAIARLLDKINPPVDAYTKAEADARFATKADLAGLATKEEVNDVRRLVNEFQTELTTLGVELDAVKRRLDGVEGRLAGLEEAFKRVQIGGAVNLMVRGNHRTDNGTRAVVDKDGYRVTGGRGTRGGVLADNRVLHDLDLSIRARLSDTATAEAVVNFGNYLDFLSGIGTTIGADYPNRLFGGPVFGARSDRARVGNYPGQIVNQDQEQTIYKLMLNAPITLPGLGAVDLSVGRIPLQFTPYTLKLIDTDSYFYNDKTDLGDIPVDGAKGIFKLGPVGITTFAAKTDPIKYLSDTSGKITGSATGYGLFAGAGRSPFQNFFAGGGFRGNSVATIDDNGAGTGTGNRPKGSQISPLANGAMAIEQMAGVRAVFGTSRFGTIGGTYLASAGRSAQPTLFGTSNNDSTAAAQSVGNFERVYVYGADIQTSLSGIGINASYTKSDTAGRYRATDGDTRTKVGTDNFAFDAAGSYSFGSATVGAGYKEVAPFFASPGYWGHLGSWINPTDIKGPYLRGSYAFGGGYTLVGEANFFEGTDRTANGLSENDEVRNYKIGIKYGLSSLSNVDLGYENTRYSLTGTGGEPEEEFINIGYGYSFNPTTSLKLLYQIIDYSDKGTGFDTQNSKGGVAAAQFSVKF